MEVQTEVNSFVPIHRLEVMLNGHVVAARMESSGARKLILKEKIKVTDSCWLLARCASRFSGVMETMAHTSPVYVQAGGEEVFSPAARAYAMSLIDGAKTWAQNLATRPDPERFAQVLNIFTQAGERHHRRMHQHRLAH